MSKEIIKNNSDFIFVYEAKQTNPNGDPDMENKPRMDYDTKTNLVSKYRLKRYIRDYAKNSGKDIFVDMIEEKKVSMDTKLKYVIDTFINDNDKAKLFLENIPLWNELVTKLDKSFNDKSIKDQYEYFKNISKKKTSDLEKNNDKEINRNFSALNNKILTAIVKNELYDIRLFGSAFAIEGFSKQFIGPVQVNWGYSLHPVDLMKTNSLVTIMNDDSSTFGKTYNVEYSLIAFNGTISKNMASKTCLTQDDLSFFREAIIKSINHNPTTSKANQYPVFYFEVEYKDTYDGFLCDLRDFLDTDYKGKNAKEPVIIRNYNDVSVKIDKLIKIITENKDIINKIYVWESSTLTSDKKLFDDFKIEGVKIENLNTSIK